MTAKEQSDQVLHCLPFNLHLFNSAVYLRRLTVIISGVQNHRSLRYLKQALTVKILKFGTPQTSAIIVLKIEKFDVTLH